MKTPSRHLIVDMPDQSRLAVSYYCSDDKLPAHEKDLYTELILQLHDCHCRKKVLKSSVTKKGTAENIVERTVINAKGHLC